MTLMNRVFASGRSAGFWPSLGAKIAVALTVCLGLRVLLAQAPPAAGGFVAPVEEDEKGYKRLVPHKNYYGDAKARQEHTKLFARVRKVLTGESPLAENRGVFDNYYNLVYFPVLTQTTDDALRTLSDERVRFMRDHLGQSAKAPDVHAALAAVARNTLTSIVRDNFHPAVRYNAMLIISGLNDQEATTNTPAIPMGTALQIILDEFKRPENSDAVRLAALLGLSWHLEGENSKPTTVPPMALKGQVIDELLKFVETKEPPEGRSADGHLWMRRRAVEALAIACQSKPDAKIAVAMDKLLRDETEPLALRCTVAQSLGKVALTAPVAVDVPALAKELGYLALEACDTELTRAITGRKEEDERIARQSGTYSGEMPGGSGYGGMPGSPDGGYGGAAGYGAAGYGTTGYTGPRAAPGSTAGMPSDGGYGTETAPDPSLLDPKHYRFDLIRRRIRHELYCVQLGLLGGEDHPRPKAGAKDTTKDKGGKDSNGGQDKRGLFAVAKAPEKQLVNNIYYEVRDLIDVLENRATDTFMLDREMRKKMKNLENLIGKRTPAAAPGGVPDEDVPTASVAGPGKGAPGAKAGGKAAAPPAKGQAAPANAPSGKPAPGKAAPTPAKATPPIPTKATWKRPPGSAPGNVYGSVRR